MVYFDNLRAPAVPDTLDYVLDDLSIASIAVTAEVPLPAAPGLADLPAIAEGCLPEIEAWAVSHIPGFERGPRVRVDGRRVCIAGRLGRSRIIVLPLTPWFDADDDDARSTTTDRIVVAKSQVEGWTGKILKALDKSGRLPGDPIYQDLFVWVTPASLASYELESYLEDRGGVRSLWRLATDPLKIDRLPGRHVLQALDERIGRDEVVETRRTFDELAAAERGFLARMSVKYQAQRRWLAAALRDMGLDATMARLERDGVRFEFLGTMGSDPEAWGQQAVLPNGIRLLVLLHASTSSDGLALANFGAVPSDDAGDHGARALFHAKRIRDVMDRMRE